MIELHVWFLLSSVIMIFLFFYDLFPPPLICILTFDPDPTWPPRVVHTLSSLNLYEESLEEDIYDELSDAIADPTTQ